MPQSKLSLLLPDLRGGGAERVAVTLANGFRKRGHAIEVVLMRAEGPLLELLEPGISVVDLASPRIRHVPSRFAEYLRKAQPAGVLVLMWPLTIAALLARKFSGSKARVVVSEHSTLSEQYSGSFQRAALKLSMRLLYLNAAGRVTVSRGAALDLAAISGLDRSAFEVIGNPLDLPAPAKQRLPDHDRLWTTSGARILTIGSLKAEKDHALLIRSFAALPGNPSLIIVGEGPERPRLESLSRSLGIADRVHLPGFHLDPWPFLASADLFVLSSRFEGLPLVLVEALHAGLPVVSTDCPSGPSEILEDGRYGQLVPVGDEAALTEAMAASLGCAGDRGSRVERAAALANHAAIDRYLELLTGSA